ncbi:protein of unknown function DUF4216 - like 4 [Theobroma cacao]|nr:protein of unknown function DUF4216 - like 4 [Theobroma cacao]
MYLMHTSEHNFFENIFNIMMDVKGKTRQLKGKTRFEGRLLPITFRDMVPNSIWDAITKISHFFRDLYTTKIHHLPIHLPYEARVVEEVSSFCSLYFELTVRTRLNQVPRNDDGGDMDSDGCLSIFNHLGQAFDQLDKSRFLDEDKIFDEMVKRDVVHISKDELEKIRDARFTQWFQEYVTEHRYETKPCILEISHCPGHIARCYKGYFINDFKFHILDYGQNRKTMNSGVCVKESFYNAYEHDFYRILVDIIELEYFGIENKVVLFKCYWFDTEKSVRIDLFHGLTEIKQNSMLATNEPFVLVIQAHQVYYSSYP